MITIAIMGFYHPDRKYPFYDYIKRVTKPLEPFDGSVLMFESGSTHGWTLVRTAPTAREDSRRELRNKPASEWKRTAVEILACSKCGNQAGVFPLDPNSVSYAATCAECNSGGIGGPLTVQ